MELATNGGTTSCEIEGSGPPLVLLHGFEGSHRTWANLAPWLRERWTVVTYDQRDTGATTFPVSDYTLEDLADDLAALIEALGHDRAHVLGTSFGGALGQALAIHHPDRIDRLVLASTSRNMKYVPKLPDYVNEIVAAAMEGDPAASRRLAEMYFDPRSLARDPGLLEKMLAEHVDRGTEQTKRRAEALRSFDAEGQLATFDRPTLVFQGRSDPVILAEESLHLAAELPRASLIMLDGVGHAWVEEAPDQIALLIDAFFRGRL